MIGKRTVGAALPQCPRPRYNARPYEREAEATILADSFKYGRAHRFIIDE